jgi:hypothetical protein
MNKNGVDGQNTPIQKAKSSSKWEAICLSINLIPRLFPLTAQVDFGSIARLNLTLIQFDKASITSQQWENLPR